MKKIFLVLVASVFALLLSAQGTLRLTSGATIKSSGDAYLVLNNMHVVNDGSLQLSSDNGVMRLTGNLTVNLTGNGTTSINQLLMEKTGPDTVNMQSNISIVSKVDFSGGLLNLNNSKLDLGTTGEFTNESEVSRAFTTGTGYIEVSRIINSPDPVNLGNLGAMITSTANLGHTTIRRGHAVQTGVSGSNNSVRRFFDIIPLNNQNLKAVLRFFYFDAESNGIPESTLHQWKSKDNINWDFVGSDARDVGANYVEKKSINKFDRWTLATATAPGIINCSGNNMTVSANQNGCKALVPLSVTATGIPAATITYRIANKIITSPYVFSKGSTIVTATASNGISPDAVCTFTVTVVCGPVPPSNRMATAPQQAFQGTSKRFNIVSYPNPSANNFSITVEADAREKIMMQVTDMYGRVIEVRNISANSITRFGDRYRPGTYLVRIIKGKESKQIKLIKVSQ